MKDSSRNLWQQTIVSWLRAVLFCAAIIGIILVLPVDTPERIAYFWYRVKSNFARHGQPLMDFLTNKDMEKALGQYDQFKSSAPAASRPSSKDK